MDNIHASQVASITELKKNPSKLIKDANGLPVAILNHNTAAAYLIPSETYEKILERLDNEVLADIVQQRFSDHTKKIKVKLDDL